MFRQNIIDQLQQ